MGIYRRIHEQERQHYSLKESFLYPYSTLRSRINRKCLKANGNDLPLKQIEMKILALIKCMNNIKRSLTMTDGIDLINDIIKGTQVQANLIQWKKNKKIFHNDESGYGRIGKAYFRNFLCRYKQYLKQKTIDQYAIDCSNFTSYRNFSDMYNHIEKILLMSKVATQLEEPVSMSKDGKQVPDKIQGYGLKVPIQITRPDMCLVLDKCGCNISQQGNSRIGQEKFLAGPDDKAYSAIATKNRYFTHIGVTSLNGEALMYVIIISGKTHNILVELGIDMDKLMTSDIDFKDLNVIRATMTDAMLEDEKRSLIFPQKRLAHLHPIHYRDTNSANVEICHEDEYDLEYSRINLNGGCTSRYVTETIVTDNDRQLAGERSQKLEEEGKTLKQRLSSIKTFMTLT